MHPVTRILLFALALAVFGAAAAAPSDVDWDLVADTRAGECGLQVTGNGKVFRIAARGLEPGADARYVVTNGDMRPLDWRVRADAEGRFARYYLPFRWHHAGDTVVVFLDSAGCSVTATFDWERQSPIVR